MSRRNKRKQQDHLQDDDDDNVDVQRHLEEAEEEDGDDDIRDGTKFGFTLSQQAPEASQSVQPERANERANL
jgi:hypothetical protein